MALRCALRDEQPSRDLTVGQSLGDEVCNFALAPCEIRRGQMFTPTQPAAWRFVDTAGELKKSVSKPVPASVLLGMRVARVLSSLRSNRAACSLARGDRRTLT